MAQSPQIAFEGAVLDQIERSPNGNLPLTPAYQDALQHLKAHHQVYPSADYPGGWVTARSLTASPAFAAANLAAWAAQTAPVLALEENASIFARYLASLAPQLRPKAEAYRLKAVGKPIHHRKGHGTVHDPVHSLLLVPGLGLHPGLPGNYLFGWLAEVPQQGGSSHWAIDLHDNDDGGAWVEFSTLAEAVAKWEELVLSAPFSFAEAGDLGLTIR